MKKLLAWLLAFMLPCCVLAETNAVTLEVSADSKLFPAYAAEALQGLPRGQGSVFAVALRAFEGNAKITMAARTMQFP